ncbi:MAG TPA: UvrD-helicase domain-containing protein [Acidimicrobiales bacterium]
MAATDADVRDTQATAAVDADSAVVDARAPAVASSPDDARAPAVASSPENAAVGDDARASESTERINEADAPAGGVAGAIGAVRGAIGGAGGAIGGASGAIGADTRVSDASARAEILAQLDRSLFVEAGAGTGKTTALVGRVLSLVASGAVRLSRIAAITFTEAAAAELRDRVYEALEQAAAGNNEALRADGLVDWFDGEAAPPGERARRQARARTALEEIDSAPITTLHGFAQRILTAHPFEAGLPPTFDVLDEGRSAVAFDDRWSAFIDQLLDDPLLEPALTRAFVCGISLKHLRSVAEQFNQNWDLLVDVDSDPGHLNVIDAGSVIERLEAAYQATAQCSADDDRLAGHIEQLTDFRRALASSTSELETLQLLVNSRPLTFRFGQKGNWSCPIDDVRDMLQSAESERLAVIDASVSAALSYLIPVIRSLTLRGAEERRSGGRLEFHDLLVQARQLVRHDVGVRVALHNEFQRLLIDEFQDTDPIQAELAVRIANGSPNPAAGMMPWSDLPVDPGRLFFVGDPKQSIYRFRRADVALFLEVADRHGDDRLSVTGNHRSVPGIIDWVNSVFGSLLGSGEPGIQPAYESLVPRRPAHSGVIGGLPPVALIGGVHETPAGGSAPTINDVRDSEARDMVDAIVRIRDERWPVGAEGRAATLEDIAVLIPTRTGLGNLQDAFESARIPYRLESSSLIYDTIEVHELLTVLRAVDDPTDHVSIVAALRSSSFGCGDDDLLTYRQARGSWDYRETPPDELDPSHPVITGMAGLHQLHAQRWWQDVSGLIELVMQERKLLELGLDEGRPRDVWRRLRFVADQARQFTDSYGGDLRRYLAWVELQQRDDVRAVEVVLPESDDDAVRVLTVHGAKGLEFPIVFLTGLSRPGSFESGPQVLWGSDGPEVKLTKRVKTGGFDELATREAAMNQAQDLRLLYVAATRARDHLVVSLHHQASAKSCHAAVLGPLCAAEPDLCRYLDDGTWAASASRTGNAAPGSTGTEGLGRTGPEGAVSTRSQSDRVGTTAPILPEDEQAPRRAWEEQRAQLVGPGGRPRTLAATTIAALAREKADAALDSEPDPGLDKDGTDIDLPAWRRGRAGTSIGRAVHGVLQAIDLDTGAQLDDLVRLQASAEGVPSRTRDIARRVRAALDSEIVRDAVAGDRYWRELYVGTPVGDRTLEGFIDLLIAGPDGYTVVDYKTDAVATDSDLDRVVERYRLQGATYALAVERALGVTVNRCVFLFLRDDGAVAREVDGLNAAMYEVELLVMESDRTSLG